MFTEGVNQQNIAGVGSVHSHQLPDEHVVGSVRVQDLKSDCERITDHGRGDVVALLVCDPHPNVRRLQHQFLSKALVVQLLPQLHGLVHHTAVDVVHTAHMQTNVSTGHNLVMVLQDDLCAHLSWT